MDSSHDGRQHLGRFLENNDGSTIASGTAAAAVDYLVAFGEGQSNSRNGGRSITESRRKALKPSKMFDEEVDKYDTYEDYLDTLVSEDDHFYLEDETMARIIAELGYRSSGDTLSRENFYKMKNKLNEKRQQSLRTPSNLSEINLLDTESSDSRLDTHGGSTLGTASGSSSEVEPSARVETVPSCPIAQALRFRARDLVPGGLQSVIFIRTKVYRNNKRKGEKQSLEISGHIDLNHRQSLENIIPYLTGQKKLVPRASDLTYYNWKTRHTEFHSSSNIDVKVVGAKLILRHKASGFTFDGSSPKDLSIDQSCQGFLIKGWESVRGLQDQYESVAYFLDITNTCSK